MSWRHLFVATCLVLAGSPSQAAADRAAVIGALESVEAGWSEPSLEVWLEKQSLRKSAADRDRNRLSIGDWRHILLQAETSLFLTAIQVDSDGAGVVLLPSAQGEYRLEPRDRRVLLETPSTPHGEAVPPMGPQDVFVFGASKPITLSDLGVTSPFLSPDEAIALAQRLPRVLGGQPDKVAAARLQLAIIGRDTRGFGPAYTAQDIVDFFTHEATRAYRRMPTPIHFEFDEERLTDEAARQLDEYVLALTGPLSNLSLMLEGHTDTTGEGDYNMNLSKRRAEAAMKYLISKGVDARRLVMRAMGENQPMYENETTDWHMQQNRRVEFRKSEAPR
jgi:outer membrane protein OmpA-like peptidoglycan-associated protein